VSPWSGVFSGIRSQPHIISTTNETKTTPKQMQYTSSNQNCHDDMAKALQVRLVRWDTHLPAPTLQPSFTRMLTCEKKRGESHGQAYFRSVTLYSPSNHRSSTVRCSDRQDSDLILTPKQMKKMSDGRALSESRVYPRLRRFTQSTLAFRSTKSIPHELCK
jgi:hypothetical protein